VAAKARATISRAKAPRWPGKPIAATLARSCIPCAQARFLEFQPRRARSVRLAKLARAQHRGNPERGTDRSFKRTRGQFNQEPPF
jgi:hypothetical protein